MSRRDPVCRFYFQDAAARSRSGVWRVWTGHKGEDVYVAPSRIAGEFKLSIHRDGMNQIGYYSQEVKRQIRAADKHYLHRRARNDVPYYVAGWRVLCILVFNSNEFESVPLDVGTKPTQVLNAPTPDLDAWVFVIATDDRANAGEIESPIAGELPRPNGGSLVITGGPVAHDPSLTAAVDTDRDGFGWQAPSRRGSEEPFGFVCGLGDVPRFAEYSTNRHDPPPLVPNLPGLDGVVHPWADAPTEFAGPDAFCAVVACSDTGASVYVDPRAHCTQSHLVADVNDLISAFKLGLVDDQWRELADGRTATGVTMRATADAAGLSGYRPNPMKALKPE
ncbi:hypothetical protein nbrc107696_39050 [Gordonia spumicola]|uniref:Uncharacterized protein n=1 Tax=Gordonia spumicola TaxID=589161 RepID=A0A7I9VDN9_9ACTN|nr:hypothetical protein [Gordonia spumicola]GEE03459.1 hypothetical protein nbrc107696_39050 [Gordonia spumicola]